MNIYESLGVKPLINAAGTFTDLGGSLMAPEVIAAWTEAAQHFVDLRELQDRVGERIAKLLRVEAALVTGGAASGILLGTAAAITRRNSDFVQRPVVSSDGHPYEVLRQRTHRDLYDRQIETCGVTILEVETEQDLERLVSDRTVLMMSYNIYEPNGRINHAEWLRLAAKYSIPTLLDAAADTPPVVNLSRFAQMGFDMVTFSGGKAIQGPQSTGLLVGCRELIRAAKQNAVPNEGTIGRVAKVSKEDIVAFYKALELSIAGGDGIHCRCEQQLRTIESMLSEFSTLQTGYVTPELANHFPHLLLEWDEQAMGMTSGELALKLRQGSPPIATGRVYGTGTHGLLLSAFNLQPSEERIVGARIREIFQELA